MCRHLVRRVGQVCRSKRSLPKEALTPISEPAAIKPLTRRGGYTGAPACSQLHLAENTSWTTIRLTISYSAVDEPVGPKFVRVMDINKQNWIDWGGVPYCEIDEESKISYVLQMGDLVVARMADPGKSALIEEDIDAVFASYLVRLKTESLAHSYFIYGFLKSNLYTGYADGAKSGSVQANMNAKVIVAASLVVPLPALIEHFLEIVLPLRQRLTANVREARTLATVRDVLLPRFLSGDLRVTFRR